MYAIVKTGGKQYRVERGQRLLVERLAVEEGADVALEPILYRSDEPCSTRPASKRSRSRRRSSRTSAARSCACSSSSRSAATSAAPATART